MSTLVLDSTLKTIKVSMSAAAATTNPDFTVSYADNNGTTFAEGASDGALTGTTDATVVSAPASGYRRIIKQIFIENKDTAAVTVTVKYDNNGTQRTIAKVTLSVGDTWTTDGTFDTYGSLKQTLGTVNLANVTGTLAIANGGTGATTAATARTNLAVAGTGVSNTFTANQIVEVTDNTNAALRITQLGTGNALVVEDSANPDATPFVVDTNGRVIAGGTTPYSVNTITGRIQTQSTSVFDGGFTTTLWSADNNGTYIDFAKSRGASVGTQAIVNSGDLLGAFQFAGSDGTQFIRGASIRAEVDGTPGTNDMPGRLVFNTTADGAAAPTERMRIDNAGNVTFKNAYTETVYALSGTDINPANGTIQTKTLGASTTFTESLADGQSVVLMVNPSTYTVTWPTMTWINTAGSGSSPTLKASAMNVVAIWQVAGTVYGNWVGSA